MIDYAFYTQSGQYTQTGVNMEEILPSDIPEDSGVYYGQVNARAQYHDITTNLPVDMSPKPGEYYKFDYTTKSWAVDAEQATQAVLVQRQQLLIDSDWTDTLSAQARLGSAYAEWQTYRQALRDITAQPGYPITIEWPMKP
jgi:hypothetical protein